MSKQKYLLPILALIIANVLWGVNNPLIKLGLESIPVTIFMSIRFLTASLILLPFALRTWKRLSRKDFLLLILSSVIYNSLGALALNIGLTKTTSINAAVIGLLQPIILFVLSVAFLKERISLRTFIGILVALAGSIIIIGRLWGGGGLTGNLFIVVSDFCSVVGTLIFKPLVKKTSMYQATFASLFFGIIPIALYATTQLHSWDISKTTHNSVLALIYSTIAIVVANAMFFYALQRKQVQTTGVYQYIQPIATIVAAWFILAERPSLKFVLGASLVFLGVYLAEAKLSRKVLLRHSG